MNIKINRKTATILLALAILITTYNILKNPIVQADEPSTKRYGSVGISFEMPKGMRFNTSRLGEGSLSYMKGYLYRFKFENETHSPFISISWHNCEPLSFQEAAIRGYNYSDVKNTNYSFKGIANSTISGHVFLYQMFTKTDLISNRSGYIGFWNCSNSGRVHTLLVENVEDFNQSDLFELFNLTVSSLICHYPGQVPTSEVEKIKLPFDVNTLINVVLMIMLTVGFTFTFMIEGFPNFAHTSYAGIGAMTTFYLTRFASFNPYDTWPFSAVVGGLIGVFLYIGIVKPIRRNGGYQDITLTFTFIVLALVIPQLLYIFNYWSRYTGGAATRGYNLSYFDFSYKGIPGIAITSTVTCILLILWLRYFLTEDKTGLSLRAVSENETLAATIGINTHRAHCVSWFISGALSALVGSIMTMYRGVGIAGPDGLIISVMSGAILGGVHSIYGAIIGGLFVALAQDLLRKFFYIFVGLAIENWQGLLPMIFLLTTMSLFPNGLIGPNGLTIERITVAFERFKKRVFELIRVDTASSLAQS